MNQPANSQIGISAVEKQKLRHHKVKLNAIHKVGLSELQRLLGVSKIRAMELSALSEFQSLPSVGIQFAKDLIGMGYYSLKDLKGKDGAKLLDHYEKQIGVWADPCVEDQFRLVAHYARHPHVHKNWWDFTAERKLYRAKHGYPSTRPTKAWYELERFQRYAGIRAVRVDTKKELARRLKDSIIYMRQHCQEKLTLKELSEAAAVSPHHFLRQFKNAYEMTPFRYLTWIRLKKATGLLKSTQLSIAQISNQCGFESESSFIRLFKSQFSETPKHYRKRLRVK